MLIAYSTIAQIGYLFLIFPLASGAHPGQRRVERRDDADPLACFRQSGDVSVGRPHRRVAWARPDRTICRRGRAMPTTFFALGLGGLSLMGLPPSGGIRREMADFAGLRGGWPVAVGDS